jgi:hypothetical protein
LFGRIFNLINFELGHFEYIFVRKKRKLGPEIANPEISKILGTQIANPQIATLAEGPQI